MAAQYDGQSTPNGLIDDDLAGELLATLPPLWTPAKGPLYRRLAVLQPEDARVHANTARELEARGLMEEAEREWAEAARDDPAQAWYPYKRGVAAMKRGAADEAEASFTKALALNPRLAMAHKGLGVLLLGRPGRQAEARDHLRRQWQRHSVGRPWRGLSDRRWGRGRAQRRGRRRHAFRRRKR